MPDLLIVTNRQRMIVYPETREGLKWLANAYIMSGPVYHCSIEHLNDFIQKAKENDITYDEK